MKTITIALAGNPNCGKTTLFNALTGAKQYVGNWPGVTVERVEGVFKHQDTEVRVIDLPGIYSFSAYSLDEKVSREYILMDKPDVVVNILDATNLERNLYLTTQLLEMKIPVILAMNMMDMAKQKKIRIELDHLAEHLDCPVIPIVAARKKGITELKESILQAAVEKRIPRTKVLYDSVVEEAIQRLKPQVSCYAEKQQVDDRWLSIKLLEGDELAVRLTDGDMQDEITPDIQRIEKHTNSAVDIVIADGRYGFIHGLTRDVVHRDLELRKNVSDSIDKIALNRFLSIPLFLGVMYLVFMLVINVGAPFIDFFDGLMGTIFVDGLGNLLTRWHFPAWLITLLADGIGGGIQTVSTFIPPIFFMFLSLSILEDSGYMSRAAFVMDRFMRIIGLPGKAFIPMLVGFGCNVPAIMATRTLENSKDRILTILINPFMSCGARLPVYALFAAVFFPANGGTVIFGLYIIGIVMAIIWGLIFKKTLFIGETSSFVMELPPYHIPTINGVMLHTWTRLKEFVLRAGKVILFVVLLLSLLNSIGIDGSFGNQDSDNSVLSYIGQKITPIFRPMGIVNENWPATVGLITGIFAKETIVGTLDALYNQIDEAPQSEDSFDFWGGISDAFLTIPDGFKGLKDTAADPLGVAVDTSDSEALAQEMELDSAIFTEMQARFGGKKNAFAYLLFVLIYMPCVAVVAAIYREAGRNWAIFSVSYLTFLAWIVATLYYQAATFHSHPAHSSGWIVLCAALITGFIFILKRIAHKA